MGLTVLGIWPRRLHEKRAGVEHLAFLENTQSIVKNLISRAREPEFKSQLCQLLALGWIYHLES